MVPKTKTVICEKPNTVTKHTENFPDKHGRTQKKPSLENFRMESEWENQLKANGWTDRAALQTTLCLAKSTWDLHNHLLRKFLLYCHNWDKDVSNLQMADLASFLVEISNTSD